MRFKQTCDVPYCGNRPVAAGLCWKHNQARIAQEVERTEAELAEQLDDEDRNHQRFGDPA